ncbi:hypothetical protein ACFLQ2_04170 [archaeon]
MKRLVLLLLLGSLAMAQCAELVPEVEKGLEAYVGLDRVDCASQNTGNIYYSLAQLAEGYSQVAQCYKEQDDSDREIAFSLLAGRKYKLAADALCETDYSLKLQLYISSGDAYADAYEPWMARDVYEDGTALYRMHSTVIDASIHAELQRKLLELDYTVPEKIQDVETSDEADWTPYAFVVLVLVFIALVIITILRKR